MIEISWINRFFKAKAGWRLTVGGTDREYLFSNRSLKAVPRYLRQGKPAQLRESFNKLFSSDRSFTDWWNQASGGGKDDKLFRLLFPRESSLSSFLYTSAWDIPWELLVERLKETEAHSTVSLVRALDINAPLASRAFDEPMRVLILQGDDGRKINQPLNLDAEARQIKRAWASLDMAARQCIDEPQVLKATQADLPEGLDNHKPHIIWFSGHGRVQPNSSLLFADGQWVTAHDFAQLIKRSCQPPFSARAPLYAVFWACDTGRAEERPETIPVSPALFEELSNVGVLSVLAMQSPIRDVSALSMAQGLFGFLAIGFSLERAVARVRGRLIDDIPDGGYELDWATPVVWSAGNPVEHLTWNSPAQPLAQLQLLGRETLRGRRAKPSELDGHPSPDELNRARTWASLSKVWIQGRYEDAENQNRWVRALQAIQIEAGQFVVAVDLNVGDTSDELQRWAEAVHNRLLPGDFPEKVTKILNQIKQNPTSGWKRLCELPDIYLAVARPPAYSAPDWFWNPLLSSDNNLQGAIFSDQPISEDIEKDWSLDRVGSEMDVQSIEAAISRAPRLARALAALNMPLGSSRISLQDKGVEGAQSLLDWPERDRVMIETYAGPIMSATAREYILSNQSAELLKQAHNDCADMLNQREIRQTAEIREALLTHLLGADQHEWALEQAEYLCFLYREQDRPSAVLRVVEQFGSRWIDLSAPILLRGAWAYLQLGKPDFAQLFLDRVGEPTSALDRAWKHGLQAEIYKSQGDIFSKEDALAEVDAAIEECRNAKPDADNPVALIQRRSRAYRQDRARILQFLFYKKEEAAKGYEELIREWNDQPEAVIDMAVVMRNYAECLRSLAGGRDDPKRQQAHDILQEAEQLVKNHPRTPILSEILYEKARMAKSESKLSEAHELLLACREAAIQSQHYMVLAIAENRLFWKYDNFSLTRWAEVEADLEVFPKHGWAVRTLVDGRLRAARRLEGLQDFEGAFKQLEGAQRELERNPLFDMGGDKFRIAATRAGLQVVGEQIGRADSGWPAFTSSYPWASEWLRDRTAKSPEAIWAEVH